MPSPVRRHHTTLLAGIEAPTRRRGQVATSASSS